MFNKLNSWLILLLIIVSSCKKQYATPPVVGNNSNNKEDTLIPYLPKIITTNVNTISYFDALSGGQILSSGFDSIISKGVCWGKDSLITINSLNTNNGKGSMSFQSKLTDLEYGTTYFVRAYATNSYGTSYGDILSFKTSLPLFVKGGGVKDIDGNNYQTIIINNQEWMAENLKTTKLNDGSIIPYPYENISWLNIKSPGYCIYDNNTKFKDEFGCLYNGYTIETNKLCPTGWHVPIKSEWEVMNQFLGGDNVSGGSFKFKGDVYWAKPNIGATNLSGFSAKGSGVRTGGGYFVNKTKEECFWINEANKLVPYHQLFNTSLKYSVTNLYFSSSYLDQGFSVRCVKN